MAKFEGQERRMPKIEACLAEYGWKTLEDADALCKEHGINVEEIVKGVQPIAFWRTPAGHIPWAPPSR